MTITSTKDLEKIIILCQKHGVTAIELDGIKLNLGPKPTGKRRYKQVPMDLSPEANLKVPQFTPMAKTIADQIDTDELSDEQLMFYSARAETPVITEG